MSESDDRVRRAVDAIRIHVRSDADFGFDGIARAPLARIASVTPVRVPVPVPVPVPDPEHAPAPAPPPARPSFVPRVAPLTARLGSADQRAALDVLEAEVAACTKCKLHETRTYTVPGEGSASPDVLFIGEGPGDEEDRSGRPFVGRAGELLTKIIGAMGYSRETVHIANIVKCRPPNNRVPAPEEIASCRPYLDRQIAILKPKLICTLGLPATRTLLGITQGIKAARGKEFVHDGIPVIPTFHPAYLLRTPEDKPLVWQDAQSIVRRLVQLGATIPNPDALKKFKEPPA